MDGQWGGVPPRRARPKQHLDSFDAQRYWILENSTVCLYQAHGQPCTGRFGITT